MADLIFDFDGTLADSFDILAEVFYEVTKRQQRMSEAEIAELRGKPLLTIIHHLGIPWWRVPYLVVKSRKAMARYMNVVVPHEGIESTIKSLHGGGHHLYIMSTNSAVNVRHFLQAHNLNTYFIHIYGSVGLFGKAKGLRKIVRANRLPIDHCMYIGDEGRDIEASYDVGIKCIAVTWGFSNTELLEELKPYGLASKPNDIIDFVEAEG